MTSRLLFLIAVFIAFASPSPARSESAPTTSPSYQKALQDEMLYRINFGQADDIRILLERGANPNAINDQGLTALAVALDRTDSESFKIVQVLITGGADVNLEDKFGNYPIMNAVRSNNIDEVKYLLSKGAKYDVKDKQGNRLIDIAKTTGNQPLIALIQQKYDDDAAKRAQLSSPENFIKLVQSYAGDACEMQYYIYYQKSGQDLDKNEETQTRITAIRTRMIDTAKQFYTYFPDTQPNLLVDMAKSVMQSIYDQLDAMVSNRNRREHGVGKEDDMNKRCKPIVTAVNITPPIKH